MRKAIVGALGLALMASVAGAANVTYTVYPDVTSPTGYSSTGPAGAFGFDTNKPGVSATAPTGFGSSSFYANVGNGQYETFRVYLPALLGSSVTVGDLDALSYQSNTTGTNDWKVSIYTAPTGASGKTFPGDPNGNTGSFYHSRLQMLPAAGTSGNWAQQTSAGTLWAETNINGGVQSPTTSYSDIQNGAVTIHGISRDFTGESIMYVDFSLGAATGGGIESGSLDDIVFSVGGNTYTLNLEAVAPVPLPASAWMGTGLLGAMALLRRRKLMA
ncbi:MAG TPA: VPLPA-CTERM sorting domain-containing protein [Tepidisphaeraceae bacterium]|jgi:hypothetical protein|nr:VPLPA-CTERM sorting domain-containing protein [Tepidisphaeraceae bacterium]